MVSNHSTDAVSVAMREHLDSYGIGVNNPENGVFLPTESNVRPAAGTNALPHSRMHSDAVRKTIRDHILGKKTKIAIQKELRTISAEMQEGKFQPNK